MKNIITDSGFSTLHGSKSQWAVVTHKGVVMTASVKDAVLYLEISNTSGANWHGELQYSPFAVAVGDTFEVSFSARARNAFTFSVWLGQSNSPHKSLVAEENHFGEKMMTSQWQTFSHTWKPILDEESARLNFVLGQIDNTVEIKDVRLTKA